MSMLMFGALSGAGLADVSAEFTDLLGMHTPARHEAGCEPAYCSAVQIIADALSHHSCILF